MTETKTGAHKCPHKNGRLQTVYTDDIMIKTVKNINNDTEDAATPKQVSEMLNCNMEIARNKLKSLVERNIINGKTIAGRWVFWV